MDKCKKHYCDSFTKELRRADFLGTERQRKNGWWLIGRGSREETVRVATVAGSRQTRWSSSNGQRRPGSTQSTDEERFGVDGSQGMNLPTDGTPTAS
jgi:hypothetical protein